MYKKLEVHTWSELEKRLGSILSKKTKTEKEKYQEIQQALKESDLTDYVTVYLNETDIQLHVNAVHFIIKTQTHAFLNSLQVSP